MAVKVLKHLGVGLFSAVMALLLGVVVGQIPMPSAVELVISFLILFASAFVPLKLAFLNRKNSVIWIVSLACAIILFGWFQYYYSLLSSYYDTRVLQIHLGFVPPIPYYEVAEYIFTLVLCYILQVCVASAIYFVMAPFWTKGLVEYSLTSKRLHIIRRGPGLSEIISKQPTKKYLAKFHPEELHYTGVTVGNVHVGNIYKTEEYVSGHGYKTGKYSLMYSQFEVDFLSFSETVLEEAKAHPVISKYLTANGTICFMPTSNINTEEVAAGISAGLNGGQIDAAMNSVLLNRAEPGINKADCTVLLKWLCKK